jgi:phospho-N-acetylmuramoyl-pentapeptide-transferase
LIGFLDDYKKIYSNNSYGLNASTRILLQIVGSFAIILLIYNQLPNNINSTINFPFFKNLIIDLGIFFIIFGIFIIVASANAVNLTDGLDGLAIVPVMIVAVSFALIAYVSGNIIFSDYLQINYIEGSGELSVFCGAIVGSALGFLWFNAPPAKVFMGDTGSLSMGGAIGTLSVITKHEIVLAIIGGLFVLETLSVIIQVVSFKLTGKRIFQMAPLHHHFEKKGWAESTIVIRFWIITIVLALIGLSTLKIR